MEYTGKGLIDKLLLTYIRKLPNHPFKIRIVNWLNDQLATQGIDIISKDGVILNVSSKEFIGHEILYSGSYEPLTLNKCTEILKNGGTFIDIGANRGLFSIHLSTNKDIAIYAIEPAFENFHKLLVNIKKNKAYNIVPVNIALSDSDSFGYLTNDTANNSGTFKIIENERESNSYLVRLTTLSDLIKFYNISVIDLIKIDVEGFEMKVFKGLFTHSDLKPKNIIMEYSDMMERTGYTKIDCYDFLVKLGYTAYDIRGNRYDADNDLPEANVWFKLN